MPATFSRHIASALCVGPTGSGGLSMPILCPPDDTVILARLLTYTYTPFV